MATKPIGHNYWSPLGSHHEKPVHHDKEQALFSATGDTAGQQRPGAAKNKQINWLIKIPLSASLKKEEKEKKSTAGVAKALYFSIIFFLPTFCQQSFSNKYNKNRMKLKWWLPVEVTVYVQWESQNLGGLLECFEFTTRWNKICWKVDMDYNLSFSLSIPTHMAWLITRQIYR